jgi:hypothetical protein
VLVLQLTIFNLKKKLFTPIQVNVNIYSVAVVFSVDAVILSFDVQISVVNQASEYISTLKTEFHQVQFLNNINLMLSNNQNQVTHCHFS